MKRWRGPLVLVAVALCLPGPALAHRLKVFATVREGAVSGYAFFIGGGRPKSVPFAVEDAAGNRLHQGVTDDQGAFLWRPDAPGDYTVTVNAEDGHAATAQVGAARFGGPSAPASAPRPAANAPQPAEIDARIAAAVAREIQPLLERVEAMDSRLRLTDILSGIFLILGAAGGFLWLRDRRAGK